MEWLAQAGLSNALVATVLALLAVAVGACARRPALTHGIWLLVLIKLVTPPIASVAILPARAPDGPAKRVVEWTGGGDVETTEEPEPDVPFEEHVSFAAATEPVGPNDPFRATRPWLLAAWAGGALGWWGLAASRIVRFGRLLREARPADDELRDHIRVLAGRFGLKVCPRVGFVPGRVPPLVWSIGVVPRLILPEALWTGLDPEARESLLTHELAHLRRRDHWTRWLELLTGGLYWWHPVAWWARRALREAEEQCCDAWVVAARPESARTYARALMATLDFLSEPRPAVPLGVSGIGHVSCLKRRMTMIVRAQTPKALSWRGRLAVLTLGATLLPLTPTWAQRDETSKDTAPAPEVPAREETQAEKSRATILRDRFELYRRRLERLGISDEHMKKQLDEAISQMEKAFEAGAMSEDAIRGALDRMRREMDESLEHGRLAQRERSEAGDDPNSPAREETSEHQAQLEKTRVEIHELQAKLRQAEDRLARLEGRPLPRARRVGPPATTPRSEDGRPSDTPNSFNPLSRPGVRRLPPIPPPLEGDLVRPGRPGPGFGSRGGGGGSRGDRPDTPAREDAPPRAVAPAREALSRASGVPEQRVRQLEEKLETLLKEMQSLKSELRGGDRKPGP